MKKKYFYIDPVIIYIQAILFLLFGRYSSEFVKIPVNMIELSRLLYAITAITILLYGLIKSVVGAVIFIKNIKKTEMNFNYKKLLLIMPSIIIVLFSLVVLFRYEPIRWSGFLDFEEIVLILGAVVFIGNIMWLYYWISFHNRKNIPKEYMYLYCGLYPFYFALFYRYLLFEHFL